MTFYSRRIAYWRDQLGADQNRIKTGSRCPLYLGRVLRLRSTATRKRAEAYLKELRRRLANPTEAILFVFGPVHGPAALRVASCESGRGVNASNGQYLGMFQMGHFARSRYGHASTPLGQARAAFAYFVDSGRDWSPWECKP